MLEKPIVANDYKSYRSTSVREEKPEKFIGDA